MRIIPTIIQKLFGDEILGAYRYWSKPKLRNVWGGPFNGQAERQKIFRELVAQLRFAGIVETGTFRGDTTSFLHEASGLPVHTVEAVAANFGYARARLRGKAQIHLTRGDSRSFLQGLAARPELAGLPLFFYLDAHWHDDLPLHSEVEIIARAWPQAVVMIDDFKVPDDAGYTYDDYGAGKALDLDYLKQPPPVAFTAFFPAARSEQETGSKRGSVVLAFADETARRLSALSSLRRH